MISVVISVLFSRFVYSHCNLGCVSVHFLGKFLLVFLTQAVFIRKAFVC